MVSRLLEALLDQANIGKGCCDALLRLFLEGVKDINGALELQV